MKFSIIIPIYNLQDCLGETLASIERQTCQDFECICIDDGSADRSGEILDEYARKCPQIKAIHIPNGGVCAARNRGLDEAQGDWIIFLDGDDVLHPRCVEICDNLTRRFSDIDFVIYGKDDFSTSSWQEPELPQFYETRDVDFTSRVEEDVLAIHVWRFCYRRSAVKDLRFDLRIKRNMGEDCLYVVQAVNQMNKGVEVACPLVGYRQRSGSAMNSSKTVEKWHYDLIHRALVCDVVARSQKQWGRCTRKELGIVLTEGVASACERMSATERDALYDEWRMVILDHVSEWRFFIPWASFVLRACAACRGRLTPIVLCFFPWWVKDRLYGPIRRMMRRFLKV